MKSPARMLKQLRRMRKYTQEEMQVKTGINQSHISEMENEKRPITVKTAKKIASALNIDYKLLL